MCNVLDIAGKYKALVLVWRCVLLDEIDSVASVVVGSG